MVLYIGTVKQYRSYFSYKTYVTSPSNEHISLICDQIVQFCSEIIIIFRPLLNVCLFDGVSRHFKQYLSYTVAVSFIGGGNRRKPPTCRKSLTNFIT